MEIFDDGLDILGLEILYSIRILSFRYTVAVAVSLYILRIYICNIYIV